jgi:2-polyprenyl-6-methoxyphenol hydroxylase-like FAD-dependent oxidoreductase
MTARSDQVIVVGAGPTGLALAGELALAGVSCRVIERRAAPGGESRAICLHARSMETLDLRGQAIAFAEVGLPIRTLPLGFEGSVIDLGRLDSDFPFVIDIPQHRAEELLADRATRLGAEILWSVTVLDVEQDDDEVRVTVEGPAGRRVERAAYAVGCDGARSTVRDALGVPFAGGGHPGTVVLADVRLDGLPDAGAYGGLTDDGMAFVFPFRDGTCRVVLHERVPAPDPDAPDTPEAPAGGEPVTLDEVRAGLARLTGRTDLVPRELSWSGRFRAENRQVPAYRTGRVFLAGDAAFTHSPAGAASFDTGLLDAFNLGWKLAATIKGWAPDRLLDSYHDERRPAGREVLARTARQFRWSGAATPGHRLLRWLVHRLCVPLPPVQGRLAGQYSGLSVAYRPRTQHAHPLAGVRLPRGTLTLPGGSRTRLYDLFADGRFVLLDHDYHAERYGGLPGHVHTVPYLRCDLPRWPAAVLVRPDGYIAWAHNENDPALRAPMVRQAVQTWCSPVASRIG